MCIFPFNIPIKPLQEGMKVKKKTWFRARSPEKRSCSSAKQRPRQHPEHREEKSDDHDDVEEDLVAQPPKS